MDIVRKGYKVSGFGSSNFKVVIDEAELERSTESRVYLKGGSWQAVQTADSQWFTKKKEAYQFAHDKCLERVTKLGSDLISANSQLETWKDILSSM